MLYSPRWFIFYKPINSFKLNLYIFFFNRPRPFLNKKGESISSKKVLAGETFKVKVGFKAKINIVAKAKVEVEVGKFLTASRNTNDNIENVDITFNLLAFFTFFKKPK